MLGLVDGGGLAGGPNRDDPIDPSAGLLVDESLESLVVDPTIPEGGYECRVAS